MCCCECVRVSHMGPWECHMGSGNVITSLFIINNHFSKSLKWWHSEQGQWFHMKLQTQVRSRTDERDVNTIHVVGYLEWQVTVFRSDGGTHQQAACLNPMWEVQKSACPMHAASGQQTSTRGVDFILQQIVFRAASHGWKGRGYQFIPWGCPNFYCNQKILNVSFQIAESHFRCFSTKPSCLLNK